MKKRKPKYQAMNGSFFPARQLEISAIMCKFKLRAKLDVPMEVASFYDDGSGWEHEGIKPHDPMLCWLFAFDVPNCRGEWSRTFATAYLDVSLDGKPPIEVEQRLQTLMEMMCYSIAIKGYKVASHLRGGFDVIGRLLDGAAA